VNNGAVKLLVLAVLLGLGVQGALYGGAWMDDKAFASAVLNCLGDNMTAKQMQADILTRASQAKLPVKAEDVKVVIDCGEGAGHAPTNVTSRLGSAISVTKSCTVTGTVRYEHKVGLMTKPVAILESKRFAAAAAINYGGGSSSGVQMPNNVPREVPADPRLQQIE
jgi:hypothetical protein